MAYMKVIICAARKKNGRFTKTMLHLLFTSPDDRRNMVFYRTNRQHASAIVLLS